MSTDNARLDNTEPSTPARERADWDALAAYLREHYYYDLAHFCETQASALEYGGTVTLEGLLS